MRCAAIEVLDSGEIKNFIVVAVGSIPGNMLRLSLYFLFCAGAISANEKGRIVEIGKNGAILTSRSITQTYEAPQFGLAALTLLAAMTFVSPRASAAPTAEVAKRCLHYAYIVYPHKRPGAAPASGDREAYFRDCLNKTGEVPEPTPSPKM